MNATYFKDQFQQLQTENDTVHLAALRAGSFGTFDQKGFPTTKLEEWKYTNISSLFDKEYQISPFTDNPASLAAAIEEIQLPEHTNANVLYFVNGRYEPSLSIIRSTIEELQVMPLLQAASAGFQEIIDQHLGESSVYLKDGIHALNTSFITDAVFIHVAAGKELSHPVYIYHLADAQHQAILTQPRSLVYVSKRAKIQIAETFRTVGTMDSFSNAVMEVVVAQDAFLEYYKLQNDAAHTSQVSSTHIHQTGKSHVHTVTISLNGGLLRNNLNMILDAEGNETHLYGLSLLKGKTHVDNHTLIDNKHPNCFSNQLYKNIADDAATGVFSGRIIVQPDAQKTNAYQSNKNIILSDQATINAKPQLEIFADDVKCSHGCTVGQLDEEALFYLRARGISRELAEVLLLQAFATDIVEQVKIEPLRQHIDTLIQQHLSIQ
ncbi:iron-regulated ABC transporter, membrane-spanning permease [Pedobacter sp. BAL39]|uniref:Fe-S cluster assembly protein SufD n=1 Tax=Pedobacter sp. BAL39 TaxID=391596 RepID=UPI0001559652|nr:Fe-S cluster assembly protein SufD [Pedobacter sp. BAL39]EDM36191.1 iron-regulated ABC transporter, membrane-spanning permease [Pedobacter sp. BAL39]